MSKVKVGDLVEVVRDIGYSFDQKIKGQRGKIAGIEYSPDGFEVRVEFDTGDSWVDKIGGWPFPRDAVGLTDEMAAQVELSNDGVAHAANLLALLVTYNERQEGVVALAAQARDAIKELYK